jgi:hypothetical protein
MKARSAIVYLAFVGLARPAIAQGDPPTPITAQPQTARTQDPKAYVEMYDIRDLALPASVRRIVPEWQPVVGKGDVEDSAVAKLLADRLKRDEARGDGVGADIAAWELVATLIHRVCLRAGRDVETIQAQSSGALVVKATREQHEAIDLLLKGLRKNDEALPIEVRQLALDAAALQRVKGIAAAHATNGGLPTSPLVLPTQDELDQLLADPGTTVLDVPSLVTPQLDDFEIDLVEELSYIANFELIAIEGMGTIADPVVKTLKHGTTLRGRCVSAAATPGADAVSYALRVEVEVAEVKKPIATLKTELGTIQLPEVKSATIASTIAGTTGRAVLVGGVPMPTFDEAAPSKTLYLLVTVGAPQSGRK